MATQPKTFNFGFHLEPISGVNKNEPKATQGYLHKEHTEVYMTHSLAHTMSKKAFSFGHLCHTERSTWVR